jgi:hypothetical protein
MSFIHTATVWRVVMVSVVAWSLGIILATFFDPLWPVSHDQWINTLFAAYIVEFLGIKVWTMSRNTIFWTSLGASLIAVNAGFCIAYLIIITYAIFPALTAEWWISAVLRAELGVLITWSVIELLRIPSTIGIAQRRLNVALTAAAFVLTLMALWRTGLLT